jgi:hypothetical protein
MRLEDASAMIHLYALAIDHRIDIARIEALVLNLCLYAFALG